MLKFSGWPRLTWGRGPSARGWRAGMVPRAGTARRIAGATYDRRRVASQPPHAVSRRTVSSFSADRAPIKPGHGRPVSAPRPGMGMPREGGAMGGVTPRQACPRPSGLGRNLRSKTRWFTGFCNSHQVSHFATFFIDARAEISVAESRLKDSQAGGGSPPRRRVPGRGARSRRARRPPFPLRYSLALAAPRGLSSGARRDARPRVVPRAARRERRVLAGLVRRWWF